MLFFSFKFIFFFAIVFLLYWNLSKITYRKTVLLVASYVFYAAWDYRFLSLIIFSTVLDYMIGLRLGQEDCPRRRKYWVIVSLIGNLGVLFFFKYFNFFTESFSQFLSLFSVEVEPLYLNIILPLGISFYTFQTLSYTIDVYRRKIKPEKSLLNLAIFIGFFPQLTAGPIVRANEFLPQLTLTKRLQDVAWKGAVALFFIGMFKKVVVADNCAVYVDLVFSNPELYDVYSIVVVTFLFAIQMYCDFSGYSDMAIATAALMGFRFPVNFAWPFFSPNLALFWSRWHISLSSWFRDYVYSTIIGRRRNELIVSFSLMATFLLSGLWHGASWGFVIFGLMQGGAIFVFRMLKLFKKRIGISRKKSSLFVVILSVLLTNIWFCLSALFFRASDIGVAVDMLAGVVSPNAKATLTLPSFIPLLIIILVAFHWFSLRFNLVEIANNAKRSVYGVVLGLYISIIIAATPTNETPFIYFQF